MALDKHVEETKLKAFKKAINGPVKFEIIDGYLTVSGTELKYSLDDLSKPHQSLGSIFNLLCSKLTSFPKENRENFLGCVKSLMEQGVFANNPNEEGFTPLHFAVANGDRDLVELLLQKDTDKSMLNPKVATSRTPLLIALKNNLDLAKLLLENGADPNVKDSDSDTPLHMAVQKNDTDFATFLLSKSANPNIPDANNKTALYLALENETTQMAQLLTDHEATDINSLVSGKSPLYRVVDLGREDMVRILLKRTDIKTNLSVSNGKIPLEAALARKNYKVALLILGHPNTKSENDALWQGILLHLVELALSSKLEAKDLPDVMSCIEKLLALGVNPNIVDKDRKPLLFKALKADREDLVKLLLDHKADPNTLIDNNTPLEYAVSNNKINMVKLLLGNEATKVDSLKADGNTALHIAAKLGHVEIVELLIPKINIDSKNKAGDTPLHCALSNKKDLLAQLLINNNADVNSKNNEEDTPLHIAVAGGQESLVNLLLEKGADFTLKNKKGVSTLDNAVAQNNFKLLLILLDKLPADFDAGPLLIKLFESVDNLKVNADIPPDQMSCIEKLLKRGVNPNLTFGPRNKLLLSVAMSAKGDQLARLLLENKANPDGLPDQRPLWQAISVKNLNKVRLLISKGADPNIPGVFSDNTPLYSAILEDNEDLFKELLSCERTDVNSVNSGDDTPLSLALRAKKSDIATLLLNRGANPNTKGNSTQTPLQLAINLGDQKLVELLLTKGAKIDDSDVNTPLHYALERKQIGIARSFIEKDQSLANRQDEKGNTPLHYALDLDSDELATTLFSQTDLNLMNKDGDTFLHCAILGDKKALVEELVEKKSDQINSQNNDKNTPLHFAVLVGDTDLIKLLVSKGAEVNVENGLGDSPLYKAIGDTKVEIARLLLNAGAQVNQKILDLAKEKCGDHPIVQELAAKMPEALASTKPVPKAEPARDIAKITAFFQAVAQGNLKEVNTLLSSQPELATIKDDNGSTPLHIAASKEYVNIMEVLISAGAEINAVNTKNRTPLFFAVTQEKDAAVKLLIDQKADPNIAPDGVLLLFSAINMKKLAIARLLLDAGAKVTQEIVEEAENKYGVDHNIVQELQQRLAGVVVSTNPEPAKVEVPQAQNPPTKQGSSKNNELILLMKHKMIHEVAQLLEKFPSEVDLNLLESGKTPLYWAIMMGLHDMAKLLMKHGALIGECVNRPSPSQQQQVPLHAAVNFNDPDLVGKLLAAGARVDLENQFGESPLYLAIANTHLDVARVLLKAGAKVDQSILDLAKEKCAKDPIIQELEAKMPKAQAPTPTKPTEPPAKTPAAVTAQGLRREELLELALKKKEGTVPAERVNLPDETGSLPLLYAVSYNNVEMFRDLIAKGATLDCTDKEGHTLLHYSVTAPNDEIMQSLIDAKLAIDCKNAKGQTPLHHAIMQDKGKKAELLLRHKATVDSTDREGNTPLHYAAIYGSEKMVGLLLQNHANVNQPNTAGKTPLHEALSFHGNDQTINLLVAAGAEVTQSLIDLAVKRLEERKISDATLQLLRSKVSKATTPPAQVQQTQSKPAISDTNALFDAVEKNDLTRFTQLLDARSDNVNKVNLDKNSLLHFALIQGKKGFVRILLSRDTTMVNSTNNRHQTPLHLAVQNGDVETVRALIAAGAKVDGKDEAGNTPLHYAVRMNRGDLADILLAKDATMANSANLAGRTPTHIAVLTNNKTIFNSLVNKGAELNIGDINGNTPLHFAFDTDWVGLILQINTKDIGVNSKNVLGRTPLHLAARLGKHVAVDTLLLKRAEVNVKDAQGLTPLYDAINGIKDATRDDDHYFIAEKLLEANAQVDKSVLDLAIVKCGHHDNLVQSISARLAAQEDAKKPTPPSVSEEQESDESESKKGKKAVSLEEESEEAKTQYAFLDEEYLSDHLPKGSQASFAQIIEYAKSLRDQLEDPKEKPKLIAKKLNALETFINTVSGENVSIEDVKKACNEFQREDENRSHNLYLVGSFFKNRRFDAKQKTILRPLIKSTLGIKVDDFRKEFEAAKKQEEAKPGVGHDSDDSHSM